MFIDHFTARDQLGSTAGNQFTVNIWSQFLDPFIALEYLSKNPKINIKKVGIHRRLKRWNGFNFSIREKIKRCTYK